jgi:uncharacterized protein (DUF2062 family)
MDEEPGRWGSNTWLADKIRPMLPTRADLARSRLLRPVAHLLLQPALWRFTRRSVPRAVGIGLFVGILVMIPIVQPVAAALAAIPFRANVPLTAGTTLLTNPFTTPLILVGSLWIGSDLFGFPANPGAMIHMIQSHASLAQWGDWALSSAAPAMLSGLLVLAAATGATGYVVAKFVWRLWIQNRWRRRRARNRSTS